jgi:hypothetical protein
LEVDPIKNRLDVKKKDEKADMLANKYNTLARSLTKNKGIMKSSIAIG